jgi:hypothetical protein
MEEMNVNRNMPRRPRRMRERKSSRFAFIASTNAPVRPPDFLAHRVPTPRPNHATNPYPAVLPSQ